MIQITHSRGMTSDRIRIIGHAYYNPGNDIVCAGVSALACTLAAAAVELDENHYCNTQISPVISGDMCIDIDTEDRHLEDVRMVVDAFTAGLRAIANNYPDYVHMDGPDDDY